MYAMYIVICNKRTICQMMTYISYQGKCGNDTYRSTNHMKTLQALGIVFFISGCKENNIIIGQSFLISHPFVWYCF